LKVRRHARVCNSCGQHLMMEPIAASPLVRVSGVHKRIANMKEAGQNPILITGFD
jgi:hypothetical protein